MNDLRILRDRLSAATDALDRATTDSSGGGSAAMCVITTTVTTYPTDALAFYACNPSILTGDETEGATPTFTDDTATIIYAANVGTAIPGVGTRLLIDAAGGRWEFQFDG